VAIISARATSDMLTVDPTSNAMEVVVYDASNNYQGVKMTHHAATGSLTTATAVGAFFVISGSAGRVVRVERVAVASPSLTAANYVIVQAVKLYSRPAGGTAVLLNSIPLDRNSGRNNITLLQGYTAIPTPGASLGLIGSRRLLAQTSATASAGDQAFCEWDFRPRGETSAVILRAADEALHLQFSNSIASAMTLTIEAEWTVELP
jgi:hypothetical protein